MLISLLVTKSAMSTQKRNSKIDKHFVCKTSQISMHKTLLGLRLYDILNIKNSTTETRWKCQTCTKDKPLANANHHANMK